MTRTAHLFVVDDDSHEEVLLPFKARDSQHRLRFTFASSFRLLKERLPLAEPDILFCDNQFPPAVDFREILPEIRALGYCGPVVILSSAVDHPVFKFAVDFNIAEIVDKSDFSGAVVDRLLHSLKVETV